MGNLKEIFVTILDFIFPLVAKGPDKEYSSIKAKDIQGDSDLLKDKVGLASKLLDDETKRRNTVESKATIFITSTSFLATILIGITTILVNSKKTSPYLILMAFAMFFMCIYTIMTLYYSINALKRRTWTQIDPVSIKDNKDIDDFLRSNLADLINATKLNYPITNRKVDYVVVAQRCFKRTLICVGIYVVILLLYALSISGFEISNLYQSYLKTFNENVDAGLTILSVLFSLVALVISLFALCKINSLSKEK